MNYTHRLTALRRALPPLRCDALIISDLTNVRYLCGYTGTAGMVAVTENDAFFITDFRYQSQAAEQVPTEYSIAIAEGSPWKEAARLLSPKAPCVGFEAEHLSVAQWQEASELMKPAAMVSTKRVVENLRLFKDADELEIIRRAVRVADEALEEVLGTLRPGLTEWEVAEALRSAMRARGASEPSFPTIVASGARSALPHGVASEKKLENGDLVTIDMGAIVDGYCSDLTRTVCLGRATRRQQEIYRTVWRAQTAAVAALRPGLECRDADGVARQIITEAGYGEAFGHGLGHGVGLDIHEAPRLSKLGKGQLEPGMVVTVEPGIYLEDVGGVRIEDMAVITPGGAEILTGIAKPETLLEL